MEEETRFTIEDVKQRNGKGTPIWIIYKDSVYDVTSYIEQHPGGTDSIIETAGTDATSDFNAAGHSADARKILAKYKIGELVEEEKKYDANGKKKKRVIAAKPEDDKTGRSCLSICCCGLIG